MFVSAYWDLLRKDCLEKEIIQDTVPGERRQGRRKMGWIDNMEKWAEMLFDKLLRESRNRRRWNRLAHEVTSPLNEDG